MGQRPGQCQTLGLSAGKTGAAVADDGIEAVLHRQHLAFQRSSGEIGHGVPLAAAEDIVLHRVGTQLRVVAQIADGGRNLTRGQRGELLSAKLRRAFIGGLAEEDPAKGGFAAGHRAGDSNDVAGMGCQTQTREDGGVAVGEGEIPEGHIFRRRDIQRVQLLRRLHQRFDALPGDFGLLHRVEELGSLGGFDHQLGEAGEEGGKGRDVPHTPAGAEDILCAEPQNEQYACL